MRCLGLLLSVLVICPVNLAVADDLLSNVPDGWRTYAARPEIAPRFFVEQHAGNDRYILGLHGRGLDAVDGRWVRRVLVTADKHYDPEVLVTEIDLNERHLSRHLGEFRARIWREGPARPAE